MSNHFMIAVENLDQDEQKKLADYLSSRNCGWWHWINGMWLVVDGDESLSAEQILENVREIDTADNIALVICVRVQDWAGYGPMSKENEGKNMFHWLQKLWTPG